MSVEDVRAELIAGDTLHTAQVQPAARAAEVAAKTLLDRVNPGPRQYIPEAQNVVDAIDALAESLCSNADALAHWFIGESAGTAHTHYQTAATGSSNETLAGAIASTNDVISNAGVIREATAAFKDRARKMASTAIANFIESSGYLASYAQIAQEASSRALSSSQEAVDASRTYAAQYMPPETS